MTYFEKLKKLVSFLGKEGKRQIVRLLQKSRKKRQKLQSLYLGDI